MKVLHTGDYGTFRKLFDTSNGFKIVGQLFYETSQDVMNNAIDWLKDDEDQTDAFSNNEMFFCGILLALNQNLVTKEDVKILFYEKGKGFPTRITGNEKENPDGFMDGYKKFLNEFSQ